MADLLMPLQIQRQYASSLDANYEFATLEELKEYATTSALSYSGQVLYCKANDTLYKVNADKTDATVIDGESVDVDQVLDSSSTNAVANRAVTNALNKIHRVYYGVPEIGLTTSATLEEITKALPINSAIMYNVSAMSKQTDYLRAYYASVLIFKYTVSSLWAIMIDKKTGKTWTGIIDTANGTISGWHQIDILSSFNDVGFLSSEEPTIDDVIAKLQKGQTFAINVGYFADKSVFPESDTDAYVITTKINDEQSYIFWSKTDGSSQATGGLDAEGKLTGWKSISTTKTYTTLEELGLTADATIDDVRDALPIGSTCMIRTDAFTDLTQFNNIQWGYLKITTTVNGMSDIWLNDVTSPNGLYYGRQSSGKFYKWVGISTQRTYTELVQLGLTADATVDDVLSILQPGEAFTAGVTQFTNYQTLFPYDSSNDQYSRVFIQQGTSQATAYVKWFRKDGSREALANLDSNNKLRGWNEHTMNEIIHTSLTESLAGITTTLDLINALITEYRAKNKPVRFISGTLTKTQLTDLPSNYGLLDITVAGYDLVEARFSQSEFGFKKMHYGYLNRTSSETLFSSLSWGEVNTSTTTTLVTNTSTLKLDVTKKNASWYGAIKFTYLYDTSPVEVEIDFRSATDTLKWTISKGQKYIKKITYTQDADNKAHYTIGIEFSGTTYGCYQAEVIGGFADINSLTEDAFTGETTAVYSNPYGKNNGVTLVSAPEDLGLTSPCTTVQLAQAMRNTFNRTVTSGAIGVFNNGGSTITDAPSDYGLLHIEVFGHDRMMIRYDGIGGSTYAGSWIGQIKGSNGAFNSITWTRMDNNHSATEQVIGTWIDGKPIYRKSYSFEINDNYISKTLETVAIDNIIKVYGSFGGGSSLIRPVPYNDRTSQVDYSGANTSSSTGYAEVFYQASDTTLRFTAKSQGSMAKAVVIVEYTKA